MSEDAKELAIIAYAKGYDDGKRAERDAAVQAESDKWAEAMRKQAKSLECIATSAVSADRHELASGLQRASELLAARVDFLSTPEPPTPGESK